MIVRRLPFEEWDRLEGLPIAQAPLPDPDASIILVAETPEGEIVGTWEAVAPIVLEGLWIHENYRNGITAGKLLREMKSQLNALGIPQAFTLVQSPEVKDLAVKAGFTVLPGELCMLQLEK